MQDLSDDFYEFDKDNYRIIGQRTKKMYTFGDQVEVRVKETNLARRSMDFALVSDKAGRATDTGRDVTFGGRRRSDRGEERSTKSSRGSRSGSSSSRSSSRQEGPAAKGQNRRGGRGRR